MQVLRVTLVDGGLSFFVAVVGMLVVRLSLGPLERMRLRYVARLKPEELWQAPSDLPSPPTDSAQHSYLPDKVDPLRRGIDAQHVGEAGATMITPPIRVERRIGTRFAHPLGFSLRRLADCTEGSGSMQDLSSRGAFFFTTTPLEEGAEIELTLQMPPEITLGESMRVRCRATVLRVVRQVETSQETSNTSRAIGVAARMTGYEYLPESAYQSLPESSKFSDPMPPKVPRINDIDNPRSRH